MSTNFKPVHANYKVSQSETVILNMNSSNVSDALLATLLASGKLGGLGQVLTASISCVCFLTQGSNMFLRQPLLQGNEEGSGSTLLEKVLQLSGQFQGGANPQLLRLQNLAANSVAAPVTPTPVMNSGAAYGLSQSELLQALQSDQNQAQLVMIADKLRQQSQGASSNFTNRVPTMDKLLSRDQDAVNLSLGLTNDLQNGSFFSSQMGSLADTNMFRNTALAANGGRGTARSFSACDDDGGGCHCPYSNFYIFSIRPFTGYERSGIQQGSHYGCGH